MKRIILITALVVLALGALGVGVASAQGGPQTYEAGTTLNAYGWMHEYIVQALAEKLGITVEQVEEQLAAGKTMYLIALDNGVAEADLPAFLGEVHAAAFDKAVADGIITREQADFMLQRMQANSGNFSACPKFTSQSTGQTQPAQPGQVYGPGMMKNRGNGQGGRGMWGGGGGCPIQNP